MPSYTEIGFTSRHLGSYFSQKTIRGIYCLCVCNHSKISSVIFWDACVVTPVFSAGNTSMLLSPSTFSQSLSYSYIWVERYNLLSRIWALCFVITVSPVFTRLGLEISFFCLVDIEEKGATFSCPRNVNASKQCWIPGVHPQQRDVPNKKKSFWRLKNNTKTKQTKKVCEEIASRHK